MVQRWFPAVDLGRGSCPHPSHRLGVFHRRQNATSVTVQLFQTVSHPHSLFSPCVCTPSRHTCSGGPVIMQQKARINFSYTWCLQVLPLLFTSPPFLSCPLSLHPYSPPAPQAMLAVITDMALGNQRPFYMKRWQCKTYVLLNAFFKEYMLSLCRHKDVACIDETTQAPKNTHTYTQSALYPERNYSLFVVFCPGIGLNNSAKSMSDIFNISTTMKYCIYIMLSTHWRKKKVNWSSCKSTDSVMSDEVIATILRQYYRDCFWCFLKNLTREIFDD